MNNYYYLALDGKQAGPFPADVVAQMIREGKANAQTLAFTKGMSNWTTLDLIGEFRGQFRTESMALPPMPKAGSVHRRSHEIDFEVCGDDLQFVEITLDPNETVIAEAGAFMFMTNGVQMETQMGDGSNPSAGLMDKVLQVGKRVFTGESLFMTTFTARGAQREKVSFAAPYPGKIVAMDLAQMGGTMICQKQSFLCAAMGTAIGIEFTRKLGTGLFGGEGFILQRLTGDGLAFVHAGGTIVDRTLGPGETLRVDTGCLVAFQPSVSYDIQFVGGIKNTLFGGEGLFFATLTGPGRVYLQSLPFSRLADRIFASAPRAGGKRVGEGSI
ncbi:MAG TPA: TIGR00266 family protein, partial [Terriglobales bacterium]|nr:TIGR00266 family protein [Terriglobales bacterium]